MLGPVALFALIGALITLAVFFLVEATRNTREHGWALAISLGVGLVVMITPAKGFVLANAGSAAATAASWIWAINFFAVWAVGAGLTFWALKEWRS